MNCVTPAFQRASAGAFLPREVTGGWKVSPLADRNVGATALNRPTPSPLPGGELAPDASNEAPLFGGVGGGFMFLLYAQTERNLPAIE